jgi:glutathione synthase/RimK-type ligase-like ATP-grasp enzyme
MDERGWSEAVIKPIVSAGGFRTRRVARAEAEAAQAAAGAAELIAQPFLPEIQSEGEWSFVFFRNEFSHAVIKRPATGKFLCQADHGGSVEVAHPTPAELDQARRALAFERAETLYARVDMIPVGGRLLLGELELIEPSLFFAADPKAAGRFVEAFAAITRAR